MPALHRSCDLELQDSSKRPFLCFGHRHPRRLARRGYVLGMVLLRLRIRFYDLDVGRDLSLSPRLRIGRDCGNLLCDEGPYGAIGAQAKGITAISTCADSLTSALLGTGRVEHPNCAKATAPDLAAMPARKRRRDKRRLVIR